METFKLTSDQVDAYLRDGFIRVQNFISAEELNKLQEVAFSDDIMRQHAFDLDDQKGYKTKLTLWYLPGNDVYGLLSRSSRVVSAVNLLMEGDSNVCHFHSKLMQKEPRVGGAWEWHQDYGYWYKNEFLFPDQMISVMVAVTTANKDNGCLQVIKSSHKMGRLEHGFVGEQMAASQHYVDLVLKTKELIYVELNAGDALFFHPNLLHRSGENLSDKPRVSLISVYNRSNNIPYNEPSNSSCIPVTIVPDEALTEWASTEMSTQANFLDKEKDEALK